MLSHLGTLRPSRRAWLVSTRRSKPTLWPTSTSSQQKPKNSASPSRGGRVGVVEQPADALVANAADRRGCAVDDLLELAVAIQIAVQSGVDEGGGKVLAGFQVGLGRNGDAAGGSDGFQADRDVDVVPKHFVHQCAHPMHVRRRPSASHALQIPITAG